MIADDVDARTHFLAHDWAEDGQREVGGERFRCVRCGALRHWPAARHSCATILEHRKELLGDVPPLHSDQWIGPYLRVAPIACVICGRLFHRPIGYGNASTCSSLCAQIKQRRRRTQRQHIKRALKRAQR